MHDVDEGKAVLDFRVGCHLHRHQPRSLHCPRNCSLFLSLSLSLSLLSLSLSLSLGCKYTRTHDGTIAAAHFFHVLFRTYRVACSTFVWHFLFIVTRIDTLFFFRLEFAAFLCFILEQNSFPIKGNLSSLR